MVLSLAFINNEHLPLILMVVGIIIIIFSFFLRSSKKGVEKELEELSMSIYQENNQLKRRLKIIEEELLLSSKSIPLKQEPKKTSKTNQILVSQVLALQEQGYTLDEISQRSSLSIAQIMSILQTGVEQ